MPVYTPEPVTEGEVGANGEDRPKKKYSVLDAGTEVAAKVLAIEEVEKPYKDDDGVPVRKVEWTFGFQWEGEDRKAWGETSTKWVPHPGCKMRAWTQEILAAELPEEFVLNTDHLLNLDCRIVLGKREWDAGEKNGRSWAAGAKNFVEDVKRSRDEAAAPAPAKTEGYEDPF